VSPPSLRRSAGRALWAAAFLVVLVAPLVAATDAGGSGGLTLEISLVLGLVAMSALVGVVVVVSRLRSLTRGLGIEQLLVVHRSLGLLVVGLVLAHVAAVVVADPGNVALFDLLHAPPRARAATVATAALLLIALTAAGRRRLRLSYRFWRVTHVVLAATAVAGTALHVLWLRHLVENTGMRAWFAALAGGLLVVLVLRWGLRPLVAGRRAFRVRDVRSESGGVSTIVLQRAGMRRAGHAPMTFAPGQFAWLRLHRWSLLTDHPFSIASGTRPDGTVEFTVRHAGDWTRMLGRLHRGTTVYLDGPHGTFTVDHIRSTGLVLLAGGVGITPMMSMLRTLADRGDRRPHRLVVGGRDEADLLFLHELDALRDRLDLTVVPTLTRPGPGWTGTTGRIDADLLDAVLPGEFRRNQLDYFICGSAPFVTGVVGALDALAVPARRVHTEQFDMV
jgi:predicted ferric reductase